MVFAVKQQQVHLASFAGLVITGIGDFGGVDVVAGIGLGVCFAMLGIVMTCEVGTPEYDDVS